jgi:hypothetical protein
MNDMALKAQEESQGWTRPSDIAWMGYLIATILFVFLWANVPA